MCCIAAGRVRKRVPFSTLFNLDREY